MFKRASLAPIALAALTSPIFAQDSFNPFSPTVRVAPHLEPHIPRPEQAASAADKLAQLEARVGGKPNVLLFLVDDMGWGGPRRLWRRDRHWRSDPGDGQVGA